MKTLVVAVILAAPAGWGQSANRAIPNPAAPPALAPVAPTPVAPAAAAAPANKGLIERLLEPADPRPLDARERFHVYLMATVGPLPILGAAAGAGILQADNSPHEWGQGADGYFHRFGHLIWYNGVRQTITYGLAEALHEDNRYFKSHSPTVRGRLWHVLISPATARKRDGGTTVSISSLSGMAGAAGISRLWSPPSWQGWNNAASSFGITYASQAGVNAVREFLPGLIHRH